MHKANRPSPGSAPLARLRLIPAVGRGRDGLVRGARLFDIYKPKTPVAGMAEHERSLAVRVELRDDEQTLTDERIDAAMQAVLAAVGSAVGARVRA